ncbi:MAG: Asp23/Gls24 family envelope stress response protein [Actinomycetota bacterium]
MTDPGQSDDPQRLLSTAGQHLACGMDVDELLEQAADGHATQLTEHQRDCAHCQAALTEFSRVWEPVHRLVSEHVPLPAALKDAITRQIHKLVTDVWYTLEISDGGALRIAARVVARIAREAARSVPGVRIAFGRSTHSKMADLVEKATLGHRHPHAAIGVLGRTAVVELAIAVQYGQQLDLIGREVQRRAIKELRAKTGLQDIAVNVTIDDILR